MHPDKNPGVANAHENFLQLKKAYDCLKDPTEKRKYDLTRRSSRAYFQHQPGPSSSGQPPRHPFQRTTHFTFTYQQKTAQGTFHRSTYHQSTSQQANNVYNEYMERMRRQRAEDMKRRYEPRRSQEKHDQQKKVDLEKMKKMARLKLFWPMNVIYNIQDLKDRLKANVAFKNPLLNGNSAVMGFKNGQEARKAEEIIMQTFKEIKVTWITQKPKQAENANPIEVADSDEEQHSDVEFVGEEDVQATSDVEFVFEDKNHQFVISSSEDEVEEVISDDEQAEHRNESDEVHHEERIDEPEIQPEVQQEEHMDVNMENDPNENQPGSNRASRDNHHGADAESGPEVENRPEVENVDARNDVDADDEFDVIDDLLVGDLPHYRSGPGDDFSVPSSSQPSNRERAWRETIELSSSDEEEPNPFARTARRPESLSQKLNPIYRKNLIPDRKSQKRSPPDSFESDEVRSSSKKPNISSSVDSNRNLHSTRDDPCHHGAGPSEVSSGSSFMPSSRVNNSKTPANQSDSESNEDQEIGEVGAILISDSEEEETEPIRESNIQSPIIIL